MNKTIITVIAFTLILIFGQTLAQDNIPWKFVKEVQGIKTYYRAIPNSNLNEVKIITTLNANLSTIINALTDVDSYKIWAYKVKTSKVVKVFGQSESEYRNEIDFPWPLKDRDIIIHTKISQNIKSKVVTSVSYANPSALPIHKDFVRITNFNSKWTFIPKPSGVSAEYVFRSDPGGLIPAWLINLSLDEGPIKTIQNFKKQLLKEKYSVSNPHNIVD